MAASPSSCSSSCLRIRSALLAFAFLLTALPFAHAQGGKEPQPIITGTTTSSMDAPDTNNDLESYAHSPSVQFLARHMGISTVQAARDFEDLNSGVLIAVILYFLLRYVPGMLRVKRQKVEHDLKRARQATADAQARIDRVEGRLASLGAEVDALRRQAAETSRNEEARIRASIAAERERIVHSAETDIRASQAAAERGLKRYASDLAVDRAAERVRLTPEDDRAAIDQVLIDEFLQGLAGQIGKGQN
jgi:F-type H+-transporting ATPase subunit b